MALLTVITVVKDDSLGLERTLSSLSRQHSADIDLVVVDGSVDRDLVPGMLAGYSASPHACAWMPPVGVYPAMNRGLDLAEGRYVYYLNAGDVLAGDDVLVRAVDGLATHAPLWAFGRVVFLAEDGTRLPEPGWSYPEEYRRLFARGRFPAHQGVIVSSAELRAQGGFDSTYGVAADYLSILRFARAGPPLQLGFELAEFTTGGLSTRQWRRAQTEFHRARREVFAPDGLAAIGELGRTWSHRAATEAYRLLWAPGRPAHGLMKRIRRG